MPLNPKYIANPLGLSDKARTAQRVSHQDHVLQMLKSAGAKGCTSEQLCEVHWRFGASIFELRKKGWAIDTLPRAGSDAALFVLRTQANPVPQPDLMRAAAPAKPSSDLMTGICECGHMGAWHLKNKTGGHKCVECTCTTYTEQT